MPKICAFNGMTVYMYYRDTKRHSAPHIHVIFGGDTAIFAIENGSLLAGALPPRQTRLIRTWIELRREELSADWILAVNDKAPLPIDPLT